MEMGINHFGEMHRLSRVAKPDICVITNIGQCHLEFLIDRDGILRAKSEIFDYMNPEGVVCLNGDDDKLCTITQVHGKKPIFFGKSEHCEVRAKNIDNLGLDGSQALVEEKETTEAFDIRLYMPGEHMVLNALAAISVGRTLSHVSFGALSVAAVLNLKAPLYFALPVVMISAFFLHILIILRPYYPPIIP